MIFIFTLLFFLLGFGKSNWGQTITVTSLSPTTICSGNNVTVNFSWNGMSNGNQTKTFVAQYENPANAWNNIGSVNVTGSGNSSGSSSITAAGLGISGTFNVRVIRTAPAPQVNSTNKLSLIVSALTAPTGIAASPLTICNGSSSTISVTNPGAGLTTDWFTVSCGGSAVSGGTAVNFLSVSPASNTTFYARTRNTTTGCVSTTCASVIVTVNPQIGNNTLDFINGTHGTSCAIPAENENAVLTAPAGTVFINVGFASYGTPNGSCPSFTLSSCHATTSQSVCEGYLLGNNSATIPATNAVFIDPCVGTVKRLYILATYAGPICAGTSSVTITGSEPTGGNGTYTYLWESSTTSSSSGFGPASGTNNTQNYTTGTLSQTTWYRRTVTSVACSNISTTIQITVNPLPSTGEIVTD